MPDFDPDTLNELKARAKRQIRSRMKVLRRAYPVSALVAPSAAIVRRVTELPEYRSARRLGLFWPMLEKHEVDVRGLFEHARADAKRVYYPFLERNADTLTTGFRHVAEVDSLVERGSGFREAPADAEMALPGSLDLIVVPALAVSPSGYRLGYGLGFYDATLPEFCPPGRSVVVAFDFQLLLELPLMPHDVSCDYVITQTRTIEAAAT